MHLQIILDKANQMKQLADRAISLAYETDWKINSNALTVSQVSACDAAFEEVEHCFEEMEVELDEITVQLNIVDANNNTGLLG